MSKKQKKTKPEKITFFRVLKKAIKEGIEKYRIEMKQQVEKHKLLSSKSDWYMIETFICQINNDPNLKVEIKLNDGTRILLRSYKEAPLKDYELLEVE